MSGYCAAITGSVPDMRAQFGSKYPASFMRLDEAYDLKSQIDRQDKQRAAYFENYQSHMVDAASLSRQANAGAKIGDVKVTRDVEKKPETADQTADEKQAQVQAHIPKLKGDAAANVDKTSAEAKEREAEIKNRLRRAKIATTPARVLPIGRKTWKPFRPDRASAIW
ncbi:hypothetical protein [Shimia sp.]|uniref:hypothetical protein n=1 Tax=Shimia sp. TaxID=1954381 RepID=UPI003B8AE73C